MERCENAIMAEEPDIKEFIHERFARADAKLDRLIELVGGIADRLASAEKQIAGLRVDFAHMREDLVRVDHRLDAFGKRLDRIERRLELRDPALPD
jgi:hypothetical protein